MSHSALGSSHAHDPDICNDLWHNFLEDKDGLILVHWYYIVSRVVAVYRYAGYVMCVLNLRYRDQDLFGLFQIMDH